MHYVSHILMHYIALCCAINGGNTARNSISSEALSNFAKNVAAMLSPVILKDIKSQNNRSSLKPSLAISSDPENETVGQIISNPTTYEPHSSSQTYNRIHENTYVEFPTIEESKEDDKQYQERSNFYDQFNQPYNFFPNTNEPKVIPKSVNADNIRHLSIGNIEQSSSNQYPAYRNAGFNKPAALAQEPYGGFHDFSPYGHFHGYQPYNNNYGGGNRPPANGETTSEANARLENNGTNRQNYGLPPFAHSGYLQPYSPFSYGEYPNYNPYYGPNRKGENDSSANEGNGQPYNNYGPPYGTPNFYGPPDYGYNYGYNNGYNYNGNGNGQTDETAQNGGPNNSSKNGYAHPYGPPLIKPLLGTFPSPFLPYDHFHGVFKTGPVGVFHGVGYPIYADPFQIGFPFHYPYGTFHHGKNNKYLPPKDSSSTNNKDEKVESSAGELTENEAPGRFTALSDKLLAPASNSSQLKTSKRKESKQDSLTNLKNRRV